MHNNSSSNNVFKNQLPKFNVNMIIVEINDYGKP